MFNYLRAIGAFKLIISFNLEVKKQPHYTHNVLQGAHKGCTHTALFHILGIAQVYHLVDPLQINFLQIS